MSQAMVEDILERIAKLPEEDRLLLERRLAGMLEGEWQREAAEGGKGGLPGDERR